MPNIKTLQNKILEIAKYLDIFCNEHGIVYYLMGGTALGAIRHKGFIPWDDDFDVFMTYDNYCKFLKCAKKYLDNDRFYLQEENTDEWPLFFSKLRMNGTTFIEEDTKNRKMHKGIYIDIMCLNNVSSNKFYAYMQYLAALSLTAQTLRKRGYQTRSIKKKLVMFIAGIFVKGFIKKGLIKFVRSKNNKQTRMVGHFFGRARYKNTTFPKEYLGKQRYVDFENTKLPVPEKVEEYLTLRYGDYMKMPDEATKASYPVHALVWDTQKDYKEYE